MIDVHRRNLKVSDLLRMEFTVIFKIKPESGACSLEREVEPLDLIRLKPPLNPKCLGVQSVPFASTRTIALHERFRDTRFGPGNHRAFAGSQRRNGQSISWSNRPP